MSLAEPAAARFVVRKHKGKSCIVETQTNRVAYRPAASLATADELEAVAAAFSRRSPVAGEIIEFETRRRSIENLGVV